MGSGKLTTHVLDTASGNPAADLEITLYSAGDWGLSEIKKVITNSDGRCDAPLLEGETLKSGVYELHFAAGDYLRAVGNTLPEPAFLDLVPIRFGVADEDSHYHVPLLISSYGYSTYRGS
jgi:5-hydroxyisourate hydrolase